MGFGKGVKRAEIWFCMSLLFAFENSFAETWRILDLGSDLGRPTAMNDQGQVVGQNFLYSRGDGVREVVIPPAGFRARLEDINAAGSFVGTFSFPNSDPAGFCTVAQPIGASAPFNVVRSIADAGDIVGDCDEQQICVAPPRYCGIVNGQSQTFSFRPTAINNLKQVAGGSFIQNFGASPVDLGNSSFISALNDQGQATGNAFFTNFGTRAFRFDPPSTFFMLGTLGNWSTANDLNSAGTVVGTYAEVANSSDSTAFLYDSQGMRDLSSLLPSDSLLRLLSGDAINDSGEIAGTAKLLRKDLIDADVAEFESERGVLLTSAPSPTHDEGYLSSGVADFAVWRPLTAEWYLRSSKTSETLQRQWGLSGDHPIRGDFDGDGKLDLVVWRPAFGLWYTCASSQGYDCSQGTAVQFGLFGDYPLSADFDGDGKNDHSVWRPLREEIRTIRRGTRRVRIRVVAEEGQWYVRRSGDSQISSVQWGLRGDLPLPADYDGDGKTDFAVYRPATGIWYILQSHLNYSKRPADIIVRQWGLTGDHPFAADYNGDGRAELVVWRPDGIFHLCSSIRNFNCSPRPQSLNLRGVRVPFQGNGDYPVIGDFDGNGEMDIAAWSSQSGNWTGRNLYRSSPTAAAVQWGLPGDVPLGSGIKHLVSRLYRR